MIEREDTLGLYEPFTRHFRYRDRKHAGERLGAELTRYRGQGALVLGIPRGGVPVAHEVARRLGADLDVVVARKLGAPGQRELAIGAITADGTRVLNENLIELIGVPKERLEASAAEQQAEAQRREQRFRRGLPAPDVQGRIVILIDDGLATGATMRAALKSLRRRPIAKLVVAVPVGAPQTCAVIAREADELVCPEMPDPFLAVGAHYDAFGQTCDEEVQRLLDESRLRQRATERAGGAAQGPR